jgi:hypothetical protein
MRIYASFATLLLAGAILVAVFHDAPTFRDPNWQNAVPFGDSDAFFRIQAENRTIESQLSLLGVGLTALALSLAIGALALRIRTWSHLRRATTPSRKWLIILLANLTLLGLLRFEWLSLLQDIQQQEYPSWADTPAIPLAGFVVAALVGPLIITVGLLVCLWRAELPAPLWLRPRGWWPWACTLVLSLLSAVPVLALAGAVQVGSAFTIPFHLAALYWLLCGRAAAASISRAA